MYSLEYQSNIGQTAVGGFSYLRAEWDILCLSKRRKFGAEIRKTNQRPEDERFDSVNEPVRVSQPETVQALYWL